MPAESEEYPGLQRRPRKNGSVALYWVALDKVIKAGYTPKTVRLHYSDPSTELSARCHALQAQMDAWIAKNGSDRKLDPALAKTIRDLIRLYTADPESHYHALDRTTRKGYDRQMRMLDRSVGERRLDCLHGRDFYRWYNQFKTPAREGTQERVSSAHHLITMLRTLFSFGLQWGVPHAERLRKVLHEIRFHDAPPRDAQFTYEMAVDFIKSAHELGHHDMAFAKALQFELTLRQTDVIGEWEDDKWVPGLRWQDINPDRILTYTPSKTANSTNQKVTFDLKEPYELLTPELDRFPVLPSIGPMVVDSRTGRPFRYHTYFKRYHEIAKLAKIPRGVWDRDSRAGGITEGHDAGADMEDLRQHAGHSNLATTQRYNRKTLAKTKRVRRIRSEHRNKT